MSTISSDDESSLETPTGEEEKECFKRFIGQGLDKLIVHTEIHDPGNDQELEAKKPRIEKPEQKAEKADISKDEAKVPVVEKPKEKAEKADNSKDEAKKPVVEEPDERQKRQKI